MQYFLINTIREKIKSKKKSLIKKIKFNVKLKCILFLKLTKIMKNNAVFFFLLI